MTDGAFKVCPFCKEQIRQEAVKCRFCGEWLEPSTGEPKPDSSSKSTAAKFVLPPPAPPQEGVQAANSLKAAGGALNEKHTPQRSAIPPIRRNMKTPALLLAYLFPVRPRLSRSEWFLRVILVVVVGCTLNAGLVRVEEGIWRLFFPSDNLPINDHPMILILPPLLVLGYMIFLIFALSLSRLHDSGGTGNWFWWLLIGLGWIILPIRLLKPGDPGENKYGPEPVVSVRTKIAALIVGLVLIITFIVIGVWTNSKPTVADQAPAPSSAHRLESHPMAMLTPLPSWSPSIKPDIGKVIRPKTQHFDPGALARVDEEKKIKDLGSSVFFESEEYGFNVSLPESPLAKECPGYDGKNLPCFQCLGHEGTKGYLFEIIIQPITTFDTSKVENKAGYFRGVEKAARAHTDSSGYFYTLGDVYDAVSGHKGREYIAAGPVGGVQMVRKGKVFLENGKGYIFTVSAPQEIWNDEAATAYLNTFRIK
jgi:uncharacterized membrane protein YhaH (DUF805 family)